MTIAARTRHLASHLPPVLHVGKQSTLILIGESPLKKRNKFHHMLRSSMAVHKLRAELPATERKLRPFHTLSTRLCSEPLLLRCSVEGNPANRRSEKKSHAHCVHTSSCCNCPGRSFLLPHHVETPGDPAARLTAVSESSDRLHHVTIHTP